MGRSMVITNQTGTTMRDDIVRWLTAKRTHTMTRDNELALDLFMLGYERNELVHMLNEANQLIESLRNELDALKEELNK